MRELKYRMWNKKEKKMYDVGVLDFDYKQVYMKGYLNYTTSSFQIEDIELMQFTGLHDKNGKEIYEGDILQHLYDYCDKTDRYIVAWDNDNLQYSFENIHKRNTYMALEDFYDDYYGDYSIEVIGNIYENPELLKGADNI